MRDKDLALIGAGVGLLAILSRGRSPRGVVIPLDDELRRVAKPKASPPIPSGPAQDATRPGLEKILVSTAQAVLWKLGADDLAQDGIFSLPTAQAWQEAALAIDQRLNTSFERADNERAWVHPTTANTLLQFANDGHRPLNPAGRESPPEPPADGDGPPPIPDVQTPSPNAAYQAVNVATAQRVLKALGVAQDGPFSAASFDDGVFNFETQAAWSKASQVLSPSTDPAFERASNTRAWIHPKTAAALAKAANEGKRPFAAAAPTSSSPASSTVAEAARRAAQAAARGKGDPEDLGVQQPVPDIQLPNPPPTPINLERARQSAPKVDRDVKAKRDKYDRKLVAKFQADAGLVPDGLYGPVTQSALKYFGVKDPAKPVFKNKQHTAYQPPS